MFEGPIENIETRRTEDLQAILKNRPRATGETRYGKCLINKRRDTVEIRLVDSNTSAPLMIFFIDIRTGEINAKTEGEYIKVWKDPRQEIPLTPEDIIAEFREV